MNPPKFSGYPLRVCKSLHHCELCAKQITYGEEYFDGGYNRRAHRKCVMQSPAPQPEEAKP